MSRLTREERERIEEWIQREDLRLWSRRTPYKRLPIELALQTGLRVSTAVLRRMVWRLHLHGRLGYYNGRAKVARQLIRRP